MTRKKPGKSNLTIAINVWHVKEEEKIYLGYVWKQNSKYEKQVIPILIQEKEKWKMTLICGNKTISIVKKTNINWQWWFLLFELSSFV